MTESIRTSETTPLSFATGEKSAASTSKNRTYQSLWLPTHNNQGSSDELAPPLVVHSEASTEKTLTGRLQLIFVSFLYGTLNVSLRLVYAQAMPPSASVLSTARGWLAAVCFIPFVVVNHNHKRNRDSSTSLLASSPTRPLWLTALELAWWNFGAQALLNVSLLFIGSARAAFLTETSVVITPLISALAGQSVKRVVWLACGIAMVGLVILSDKDNSGIGQFSAGDLLALAGAFCWSFYLFRLSQCGSYDEVNMQGLKTVFLACLYSIWFLVSWLTSSVSLWAGYASLVSWLLLFYSALGPGALADIVQQKAQATVAAAEANVILAMEPVFTSILGFLLLAEALTAQEFLGGGFIIAAAICATQ